MAHRHKEPPSRERAALEMLYETVKSVRLLMHQSNVLVSNALLGMAIRRATTLVPDLDQ